LKPNLLWAGVLIGAAVIVVLVLLIRAQFSTLPTVEPESRYELPPPGVSLSGTAPEARPSKGIPGVEAGQPDSSGPTATPKPTISNLDRLAEITANWVYRGFVQIGDRKRGRFTRYVPESRETEVFFANESEVFEEVTLESLEMLAAVARLGEATVSLPLVPERRFTADQMVNPQIPSEEEVKAAQTAYWENYGKRFKEMGKKYTPRPGEIMPPPEPPSAEDVEAAKKRYMATFAPMFQQQSAMRTPVPGEVMPAPHQDQFDEQEAIRRYYERYRPWATPPTPKNN